jgi:hypothetical protein
VRDARFVSSGFTLDIADLAIAVSADADLPIEAEGSARKFVRSRTGRPDATIHASWGEPAVDREAALAFDPGKGLWRLYRAAAGYSLVFRSPLLGPEPYQAASFSEDWRDGRVILRRATFAERLPVYPLHYPLDELLMVHLLSRGLGIELHASGLETADGRGFLFVGQSGAGKTTMSRLWRGLPGVNIFSDERIIVRADPLGVWMYGTPWHGDGYIAEPGRARLSRIFFLRHGPRNELRAVPATTAAARLFACGFTPFHDASGLDFSLRLLETVVRTCACDELTFVPSPDVVDFVLAT